jgi:hypothetical protein
VWKWRWDLDVVVLRLGYGRISSNRIVVRTVVKLQMSVNFWGSGRTVVRCRHFRIIAI